MWKRVLESVPTTSRTVLSIDVHTPEAFSTDHRTATATTMTMPIATDSRNATFMTDQGSTWVNRSRARRGRRVTVATLAGWRGGSVRAAAIAAANCAAVGEGGEVPRSGSSGAIGVEEAYAWLIRSVSGAE